MKKVLLYIFIFISTLFFNIWVYADTTLELKEPVIVFDKIAHYGLQGYTVAKDKLFVVLEGYDDTKSIIKVFDLNTYKEILSYEYGSLGHANDVTYNSKNNKIYIIASSGSDKVFIFNGDTFKYEDTIRIGLPVRSITYIEDYDRYAVRLIGTGYLYKNDFTLVSKFPFIIGMNLSSEVGRQGWTYYKGLIYYANWSWVSQGGTGTNALFIYDLDGNKYTSIYTDESIGEIEGVDFYNNKMILGFNGYDKKIKFYVSDIPSVEKETKNQEIIKEEAVIVKKKNYEVYIIIGIVSILVIIVLVIILRYKKKVIK